LEPAPRTAEGGQEQGHERHDGNRAQDGKAAQPPFTLELPATRRP